MNVPRNERRRDPEAAHDDELSGRDVGDRDRAVHVDDVAQVRGDRDALGEHRESG